MKKKIIGHQSGRITINYLLSLNPDHLAPVDAITRKKLCNAIRKQITRLKKEINARVNEHYEFLRDETILMRQGLLSNSFREPMQMELIKDVKPLNRQKEQLKFLLKKIENSLID